MFSQSLHRLDSDAVTSRLGLTSSDTAERCNQARDGEEEGRELCHKKYEEGESVAFLRLIVETNATGYPTLSYNTAFRKSIYLPQPPHPTSQDNSLTRPLLHRDQSFRLHPLHHLQLKLVQEAPEPLEHPVWPRSR